MEPTVNTDAIERLQRELRLFTPNAKRLVKSEVGRQGDKARKALLETITDHYALKKKNIRDGMAVRLEQGTATTATIKTVRKGRYKIAAYDFSVSKKNKYKMKKGEYHKLRLMKNGSGKVIKRGFIAKMKSGHVGLFERTMRGTIDGRTKKRGVNKHNSKISEMTGLAMAQMIPQSEAEAICNDAQRALEERIRGLIEKAKRGKVR